MTLASTETRTVVLEKQLSHPPAKVWRALTEGPLLAQWLMPNDFGPIVGHKFTLRSNPVPNWDGLIHCEVLAIEPPARLAFSWSTMGLESAVVFALTPTDAGTHLRMEHSGFQPDQEHAYKGATYGWQRFLGNLETVVAGLA